MRCQNCGIENLDTVSNCLACGTRLTGEAASAPAQARSRTTLWIVAVAVVGVLVLGVAALSATGGVAGGSGGGLAGFGGAKANEQAVATVQKELGPAIVALGVAQEIIEKVDPLETNSESFAPTAGSIRAKLTEAGAHLDAVDGALSTLPPTEAKLAFADAAASAREAQSTLETGVVEAEGLVAFTDQKFAADKTYNSAMKDLNAAIRADKYATEKSKATSAKKKFGSARKKFTSVEKSRKAAGYPDLGLTHVAKACKLRQQDAALWIKIAGYHRAQAYGRAVKAIDQSQALGKRIDDLLDKESDDQTWASDLVEEAADAARKSLDASKEAQGRAAVALAR